MGIIVQYEPMGDDEILSLLKEQFSFFEMASQLYVPPEMLTFKLKLMQHRGHNVPLPPINANGNFLKKL